MDQPNRGFVLAVVAVMVLGLAGLAFAATRDGGSDSQPTDASGEAGEELAEVASVELVGDVLPPIPDGISVTDLDTDPVAGEAAPTLLGTGFNGEDVTIEPNGSPKVIYFLAHWGPHCQAEVPLVQELIDAGQQPDGLEIYAVSTAVDEGRGNYPPSDWLEGEGLAATLIRDDEATTAMAGFGGRGFPYVVYLDAEHKVVARSSGSLDKATIEQLWLAAAG